ncbi:unnamed protein product, partial [Prorocentrum cordatum]
AIIAFGLLRSLLVVFLALNTVVFHGSKFEFTGSATTQIFTAAMALAGVPVMLAALWGASAKAVAPIRLYVYYMLAAMAIDLVFILKDMVISGPCQHLPGVVGPGGAAFACGIARMLNSFTILFVLGVELYFIFVVRSYAEELRLASGQDLSDLAYYSDPKARRAAGMAAGSRYGAVPEYGGLLESRQRMLGGSTAIFSGGHHELRYPRVCGNGRGGQPMSAERPPGATPRRPPALVMMKRRNQGRIRVARISMSILIFSVRWIVGSTGAAAPVRCLRGPGGHGGVRLGLPVRALPNGAARISGHPAPPAPDRCRAAGHPPPHTL